MFGSGRAPDAPVKVIDFSLAVFFQQPAEPCGTPEFMAPELITNPDEVAKTGRSEHAGMHTVASAPMNCLVVCLSAQQLSCYMCCAD